MLKASQYAKIKKGNSQAKPASKLTECMMRRGRSGIGRIVHGLIKHLIKGQAFGKSTAIASNMTRRVFEKLSKRRDLK